MGFNSGLKGLRTRLTPVQGTPKVSCALSGDVYLTEQYRQCTYNVNIEARSCNHRCSGKSVSITKPECVCICRVGYTACNAHALYFYLWSATLYSIFPHYLLNDTIFRKRKMLLTIKRVIWFSLQFLTETFLILRRNERDMSKTVYWSDCKVPVILVRF
jgi:hypothetical protein